MSLRCVTGSHLSGDIGDTVGGPGSYELVGFTGPRGNRHVPSVPEVQLGIDLDSLPGDIPLEPYWPVGWAFDGPGIGKAIPCVLGKGVHIIE